MRTLLQRMSNFNRAWARVLESIEIPTSELGHETEQSAGQEGDDKELTDESLDPWDEAQEDEVEGSETGEQDAERADARGHRDSLVASGAIHPIDADPESEESPQGGTDDGKYIKALVSVSCLSQVLVALTKARFAEVPTGRGANTRARAIVYAATIDAIYRADEAGDEPAAAAQTLCTRLASLAGKNRGFSIFSPGHERGAELAKSVEDLMMIWRMTDQAPAAELQPFDLNQPEEFVLTNADRRLLDTLFDRAKRECEETTMSRSHLRHHLDAWLDRDEEDQHG
jgi:hypothetical protein